MIKTRTLIHQEVFRYCMFGIAFLLPVYGRTVPPLIAVMVLNWIVEGGFRQKFNLIRSERMRRLALSFGSIYLLYLAGLIYSSNIKYGLFDLQVKLSLFIFPLLFATADEEFFKIPNRNRLLIFFIMGCLAGSIMLMGRALIETIQYQVVNAFFYGELSWYFHSSYLSMYYDFALVVLIGHVINIEWKHKILLHILEIALILWLIILVFLLSSKAGILILGFIFLFYVGLLIFRKRNWNGGITLFLIGFLVFFSSYHFLHKPFERMEIAGNVIRSDSGNLKKSTESNTERIDIWSASLEIIQSHTLIGVGTGDVKDALNIKYLEKGMDYERNKNLNVHCQYLQTFVALGIAGILFLLFMLVMPGIIAIRRNDYYYLLFLLIFAFNILVESMFEIQAGVVFYAFFNAFLFNSMNVGNHQNYS